MSSLSHLVDIVQTMVFHSTTYSISTKRLVHEVTAIIMDPKQWEELRCLWLSHLMPRFYEYLYLHLTIAVLWHN